jgi:hypothetical protein
MVITYQGGSYFRVQSGEFVVLIDPTNARAFKSANIVINTVKPPYTKEEKGPFWIEHQGEYEREGTRIVGVSQGYHDGTERTAYRCGVEGISIAMVGYLAKEPDGAVVEKLQGADILIVPTADAGRAAKLTRQIEPGIVIPTYEKDPKKFFDELSAKPTPEDKLTIKKKEISVGAMEIRHLTA